MWFYPNQFLLSLCSLIQISFFLSLCGFIQIIFSFLCVVLSKSFSASFVWFHPKQFILRVVWSKINFSFLVCLILVNFFFFFGCGLIQTSPYFVKFVWLDPNHFPLFVWFDPNQFFLSLCSLIQISFSTLCVVRSKSISPFFVGFDPYKIFPFFA